MLLGLEMINFENHKHTRLEFGEGFNVLFGPSNTGKTSAVRALRLVAYNEWDPECLRLGTKKSTVIARTDKGTVKVERGKNINNWEITPLNGKTICFSRPGKNVIPEAAEVMGLNAIELGSYSIQPNIMDQLEGHFFLAEVDGEKVSGSSRAQIIDEISGLAGMEELVRQVGLDNIRNSRSVKQLETSVKDLEKQKNDEAQLEKEKTLLNSIEQKLITAKKKTESASKAYEMSSEAVKVSENLSKCLKQIEHYEGLDVAADKLEQAEEKREKTAKQNGFIRDWKTADTELSQSILRLQKLPNLSVADEKLIKASEKREKRIEALKIVELHTEKSRGLEEMQTRQSAIGEVSESEESISLARKALQAVIETSSFIQRRETLLVSLNGNIEAQEAIQEKLSGAERQKNEAMKEIDLCPICLKPVHEGCDAYCSGEQE